MTTDKLKQQLGNYKWSLLVAVLLLVMIAFGYKLARMVDDGQALKVASQAQTIALLVNDNNDYVTRVNQLDVALQLAQLEKQALAETLNSVESEQAQLLEQLAFYQRIMAPETTQDGFVIEGVEITPMPSANQYQLRFVVLQQSQNKAVVKGKLAISIGGEQDEKSMTVSTETLGFIQQDIEYRFKYFQAINTTFTLPDNFSPSTISLSTTVYQYNTRRGSFSKSVEWDEAFSANNSLEDAQ